MGGQQSKSAEAKIPKTVIDETGLETHTMTIHDKRVRSKFEITSKHLFWQ